tara:strand:- start:2068 stop:3321 length:1254 start_codon:yes stop_codon:yes gene_type:complete
MNFTKKILFAMAAGIIIGIILNVSLSNDNVIKDFLISNIFETISVLFLSLLKMIVLPLIFVSIICGTLSMSDPNKLTRLGFKTILLYMLSTVIAISIALIISNMFPYSINEIQENSFNGLDINEPKISEKNFILNFIPENFFFALSSGNVLQVLFFALFMGITASFIKIDIPVFVDLMENLNQILINIVFVIIKITPLAVFCLLAKTFANQGVDVLTPLIQYFVLVIVVLLIHFFGSFYIFLTLFSNLNPFIFYKKLKQLLIFTFSTSSSNASIPYTLDIVTKKYGVDKSFSSFSIPLGATINMDGTAIMQGCAAYFLASYYGIALEFTDYLTIIATATLASIGTAGIPSAGIIMLSVILEQIGIPLEGVALLLGVDRLLDMMRTSINVAGDTCITCIVAKSEGLINTKIFEDTSEN